jgi:hypothetical protein
MSINVKAFQSINGVRYWKYKNYFGIIIWLVICLVASEIFARFGLGLGTPPLFITHSTIEYMLKPNQQILRFHKKYTVNQYGMRSQPFVQKKRIGENRIMVFGDSVINGGGLLNDSEIATSILHDEYLQADILVGNISAPSWGPGNWLAYSEEYGFFEADVIVLVISGHDYTDNPTFQQLNQRTHPIKDPKSALLEGVVNYFPKYWTNAVQSIFKSDHEQAVGKDSLTIKKGLGDISDFLISALGVSEYVLVLQHYEKSEIIAGSENEGSLLIHEICEDLGINPISLYPSFKQCIENNTDPYLDDIHVNRIGQELIAQSIFENLPESVITKIRVIDPSD